MQQSRQLHIWTTKRVTRCLRVQRVLAYLLETELICRLSFSRDNSVHKKSLNQVRASLSPPLKVMAAGHNHNGMVLYGDHNESNRTCTDLHDLARFNGGKMTGWKPLRHHMDNISKALLQFLDKDRAKYTTVQEAGMTALKGLLTSNIPQKPREIVAALDKVFFDGLLQGRLSVSVIDLKGTCEGETYFSQDRVPRTPFVTIQVHDFNEYRNKPKERRVHIVSSLVHEMCHAFLLIYGCDGRQCATRHFIANGIGFTGHGPVWTSIADEAENNFNAFICPMIMPGFEFLNPLGIPQAVKEERD